MSRIVVKCEKCGAVGLCNDTDQLIHKVNNCNGNLKKTNISENDLKMSQFKSQLEQQKSNKVQNDNTPRCPHCRSTNIRPISGLNRGASIAMWGIFSKKINKSFECLNCKYTW